MKKNILTIIGIVLALLGATGAVYALLQKKGCKCCCDESCDCDETDECACEEAPAEEAPAEEAPAEEAAPEA